MTTTTLPNEFEPLVLTERQQDIHRRYTALGFRIQPRPFSRHGDHLHFFMHLPTPECPNGVAFSINLHSGICHQQGTHSIWKIEQAEVEWGSGLLPAVSPPSVPEVKAAPVPPPAELQQPKANPLGGLTAGRSPEKPPARKKQTSLF